jgi:hypothetical protein
VMNLSFVPAVAALAAPAGAPCCLLLPLQLAGAGPCRSATIPCCYFSLPEAPPHHCHVGTIVELVGISMPPHDKISSIGLWLNRMHKNKRSSIMCLMTPYALDFKSLLIHDMYIVWFLGKHIMTTEYL